MIRIEQQHNSFSMVPDLTALLDIIFIVLVFLLLTANSRVYQMDMDLPSTSQEQSSVASEPAELQLSLFQDNPIWGLDEQRYQTFADFEQAIKQQTSQQSDPSVSLASERQVPVEHLLKMLELLQQLDIKTTQILMDKNND
ncbi:biopolymer transporter ExbD [Agarivorans sp. OAG1]|uniref:Biopolymer transport protein ExbD1 n=1 Tax=Agarivorans albus MKT 106 TaxID=1331007 RepID=R9PPB6_AGAAL|nr:biopolymer transporter ExbD [Agarivorans albus]BEU02192.1 biopolymer transporter ExbD [Agarivorans sp. OAG1]GAD03227.1 biopolymer transport protein ExbD1 [Agarivorans albus MKT 106]